LNLKEAKREYQKAKLNYQSCRDKYLLANEEKVAELKHLHTREKAKLK
jgi:hypothetical protein